MENGTRELGDGIAYDGGILGLIGSAFSLGITFQEHGEVVESSEGEKRKLDYDKIKDGLSLLFERLFLLNK